LEASAGQSAETWSFPKRFGLLFCALFAPLFAYPFPFGPWGIEGPIGVWLDLAWDPLVPWTAKHILGISYEFPRWGGGETTWTYVQSAIAAILAAVGALLLAPRVTTTAALVRLDGWLRVYLRIYLVAAMFSFGWSKVFPVQFPAVGPDRLAQYLGEMTPQGLLWTFMGFSPWYMAFTGVAEVLTGALLCFRRTVTIGALLGIAVMSNVLALNVAYDVGVKLAAMFYLLGFAYLGAPGLRRMFALLVLERPTLPIPTDDSFAHGWKRIVGALPIVFFCYLFFNSAFTNWNAANERGQLAPVSQLVGVYNVDTIVRRPGMLPDIAGDTTPWSRVAIGQRRATIRTAAGTLGIYATTVDTVARTMRLVSRDDPDERFTLAYAMPSSGLLTLRGTVSDDSIDVRLRRDARPYRLTSHRFHWAKDTNDNR
jgi:hypothetical protein